MMTSAFRDGERVTAYLDGEPLQCVVVREIFEAGDRPGQPSRLVLRRLDTDDEISRSKDAVEREASKE
ncbi:hypothetical protein ACH4MG_26945 [Streptomyces sp. NPDC017454]|uniref:hypothetical protein n=1 Tax=Streptomyces sp. NPDC017454 TaxID=3364997 RepID=UPI00378EC772